MHRTAKIRIPRTWPVLREPPRPIDQRKVGYTEAFDFSNLFYDAVQVSDLEIALIGPPLLNLGDHLRKNVRFYDQHGTRLEIAIEELDRVCHTRVLLSDPSGFIKMVGRAVDGVQEEVVIKPNQRHDLTGRRVLMTLQMDNPVEWISQWAEFHHREHQIDTILIYDNGTTAYSVANIEALSRPGLEFIVVDWEVPYGPPGSDDTPWDSDFAQHGMLEHAKLRFASSAALVVNADIDELVISDKPLDELLDEAGTVGLRVGSTWVSAYSESKREWASYVPYIRRRFADYAAIDGRTKNPNLKWFLRPSTAANSIQWCTHTMPFPIATNTQYAHFLALNTNWSWRRDEPTKLPPGSEWKLLREKLTEVFSPSQEQIAPTE